MSLTLLVIIVAVGIALVVMAVHVTGGSARAVLDGDSAMRRFADDFPELRIRAVRITHDCHTAFLQLEDDRVGIVQAVGGKFLTRIVAAGDLAGVPRATDTAIAVRFRDLTWPGGRFNFANAEEARAVQTMFAALRRQEMWDKAA